MPSRRRITANSQSLKKQFPRIYRGLFSHCPLVCSAPGNFYWSGEYTVRYGGIAVKQNLPLRTYVGLEAGVEPGLKFSPIQYYIPSKRTFADYAASSQPTLARVAERVKKHFDSEQIRLPNLQIHAVMEMPPGCGLSASAALGASLATALYLYLGKISPQTVGQWSTRPTADLIADPAFNQVARLAWEIEDIFHGASATTSAGAGPFTSLIGSIYPIVYVRLYSGNDQDKQVLSYWAVKMEELFSLKHQPSWPIDFGLIYSGDTGETSSSLSAIEGFKDDIRERIDTVKKELAPYPALKPVLESSFFATESKQATWKLLMESPKIASIMALGAFKELFNEGLAEDAIKKLFKALNMAQRGLTFASISSPTIDYLCLEIKREMRRQQDIYGAGAKLTGRGRSGDVLFAVAYHSLRDSIDKLVARLRRDTGEELFLDYASWLDGFESEGIKVEQSLPDGLYSDFISRGAVQARYCGRRGVCSTRLYSLEQFNEDKTTMDILLDPIKYRIHIRGEQITSKELRSASTTIELLSILLSRLGEPVNNKDLPASSYTEDRNELQSKIITPLTHAIQKHLGADISLKIAGSIRNFTVTLKPGGIDYYIIDKVF